MGMSRIKFGALINYFIGKDMSNIKPGPKPKREDGKDDRRHHVNPETKPKHPSLPIHKSTK